MFHAEIIPGVLSISSNRPNLKGFPLCEDLTIATAADRRLAEAPMGIRFEVDGSLRIGDGREGKIFRVLDQKTVGMEVPIGRWGRIACAVSLDGAVPELRVNPALFRSGRLTIGNVHSIGWLLRDICNLHLLRNGYALLHGAALKSESGSVLMIGLSNTGKTSTVKRLVREDNAKTFGDDLLVTDGDKAFACPYTKVNIDPRELPSFGDRMMQRARRTVPFYEYIGPTSRLDLCNFVGREGIASPSAIDTILFLRRSAEDSLTRIDDELAFELLLASNCAEFTYSTNSLFRAFDFLQGRNECSAAVRREESLLRQVCVGADTFLVAGSIDSFISAARDAVAPNAQQQFPGI